MIKNEKKFKQKKRISITLALCMLFQIIQGSSLLSEKAFADTGFRHVTSGNDVMLGGNYIEVGVSKSGSFGTASNAPSGFHPTQGGVGLRVDGDGFDIGNPPTTGDFFLPGNPEESFTVGYKAGSAGANATTYTNAEREQARFGQAPGISTVTTDTTSGDTLSATTAGTTSDNNLGIQQKITFKVNDKFFKNTITYTNNGSNTLYDVRYMRSFDPDQDVDLNGNFQTYNCVLENFPQDNRAIVRAEGGTTKEPVFFISTDSRARASSFGFGSTENPGNEMYGFENRDPYDPNAYNVDGSKLKQPEQQVDKAIAITFALGDLAPGQSTTFEYYTSLDPNYNAGLAAIMGSLGIQINNGAATTTSTDVTLNLSGDNVAQMRFSNDNSNWSDWESYATTKAWTLTPGNGYKTVYVQFKDASGNVSNANATINYPDTTAPIFTVSGNPTAWTKDDAAITVTASDDGSGLDSTGAYSFDGGKTWTTSNSKTFSSNQTVSICVKDSAGNKSSKSVTIDKIDKAAPNYTNITQSPVSSQWTKGSVKLTVNGATDNTGSGLDALAYSFSTAEGVYNWQASNVSSDFSTNQTVYIYVRDAVGNISTEAKVDISNIDTTSPNVPVINNADNYTSSKYYNTAQTLSAGFTTTSGSIEKLQYSLNNGTWTNGSSVNVSAEGVNTVKFRVIDETGSTSDEASCVVQIDTTSPTISSVSGNPSTWTSSSVTLTVNADDALSGLDSNAYSFDGGKTWQADNNKTFDTNTNGIVIKVRDKEGNVASYSAIDITKIDKTEPKAPVIDNAASYVDSKWYNTDQVITAGFTATEGCAEKLQYKVNDGAWTDGTSVTVASEGKYSVSFRVIDELGRTGSEQDVQVNLDKTAPTDLTVSLKENVFKKFLNTITFGMFSKDDVDVDITADGNISGINYIEYQLVDASKGETFDEINGNWAKYSSLAISPEFKGAVYARAVDNAGNVSEIVNSDGVIVDSVQPTVPVISATVDGNSYNGLWTSKDIVLSASGASALAGINHYEYKFGESGTWTTMSEQTGALDATSGKAINDEMTVTEPMAGTYYFRAVSNSGIAGLETSKVVKHENTAPATKVDYTGTVDAWTKGSVKFNVSNANEDILCPVSSWIKIGDNAWNEIGSEGYTFNNEINVPVRFKTVTDAGLENVDPKIYNVKIDKTAPVISGADSGKTYYVGRVITTGDNSNDSYNAVYNINKGAKVNLPSGTLLSGTGDYAVTVTDQAGNASTMNFTVKQIPADSEVLYTSDWDNLIKSIRSEFNSHTDLPEPYKTNTDNAIKALENMYKKLLDEKLKGLYEAVNNLNITYASGDNAGSVTKAMYFTPTGINGTSVTWSSSDTSRVTNTGRVTRPEPEGQDLPITITASVKDPKTNEVITKQFNIVLKKLTDQEAVNESARLLTAEQAFSFSSAGDTWESVTNKFLLLNKGTHGTTIAWESNKPDVISINSSDKIIGNVVRPDSKDEDVILTAKVAKGNVTATKTFLMVVKQKGVEKQASEVRVSTNTNAAITSGSSEEPVDVNIKRTTLDNNAGIIDTLIVTGDAMAKLTDNIDPTAESSARKVVINMPQPTDGTSKADVQAVEIPAEAVQGLADKGASLEIQTGSVKITLDADEIKALNEKGTDLYLKVVPIKDDKEKTSISTDAKANTAVISFATSLDNGVAVLQGIPYTVETNYSGINTKLVIPFTSITIPTENRAAFLDSLRVYIEHSDGTKELKGGTIEYDKKGNPIGIEITIDRFSSFQVISVGHPKTEINLPKTGSLVDAESMVILGLLLIITGFVFFRRRRENN